MRISQYKSMQPLSGMHCASVTEPDIRTGLLSPCSQVGCDGPVDLSAATNILDKLWGNHPETISFDYASLADHAEGGICSAMTLDFLDRVMEWLDGRGVGSPSGEEWIAQMTDITQRCSSRPIAEYRNEQAALNCIRKADGVCVPEVDDPEIQAFHRDKIEALVRWKNLTVSTATPSFNFGTDGPEALGRLLGELTEGVYLIRAIEPKQCPKRELHGHTTAYIRTPRGDFFFDPNYGADSLGLKGAMKTIFRQLHSTYLIFGCPHIRFYGLSKCES